MKTLHALASGFALAAGLSLTACPAYALEGGTATSHFAIVGELGGASGVLIADGWLLTAAHVAAGLTPHQSNFVALLGTGVVDQVVRYSIDPYPANDIALVHLSGGLAGTYAALNDTVIQNSQVDALGTLTAASARNQQPNGYASTTPIIAATDLKIGNNTRTVNWLITEGSLVEGGDSGSALFNGQVTDSTGAVLLGIASSILTTDEGIFSGYVQVASYKDWIDTTLAAQGQKVTWISAVPEPSLPALLIAGGVIAGIMVRRGQRATR